MARKSGRDGEQSVHSPKPLNATGTSRYMRATAVMYGAFAVHAFGVLTPPMMKKALKNEMGVAPPV